MNSPLKQNTTTIQELLNTINTLPTAENLGAELSTQSSLISEQDAKIAELAQVLAGKVGSGSNTVKITVSVDGYGAVYGFDGNGNPLSATSGTYDFLAGIVVASMYYTFSGNYVKSNGTMNLYRFLSDGGSITGGSTPESG